MGNAGNYVPKGTPLGTLNIGNPQKQHLTAYEMYGDCLISIARLLALEIPCDPNSKLRNFDREVARGQDTL